MDEKFKFNIPNSIEVYGHINVESKNLVICCKVGLTWSLQKITIGILTVKYGDLHDFYVSWE